MGGNMNVIFNTTNTIQMTIFIFQYTPYIPEQFFPIVFGKRFFPVFGTKNNLNQALRVSTHLSILFVTDRIFTTATRLNPINHVCNAWYMMHNHIYNAWSVSYTHL